MRRWSTISTEPMSKEAIAALYPSDGAYRISEFTYPAGAKFQGAMRAGTCYVLAGGCTLTIDKSLWISAGDVVTFPAGAYDVEVGSAEPVTYVLVWEIPVL